MTIESENAEGALQWTAEEIANQISDRLSDNYFLPQGEPPDLASDDVGSDDHHKVIWLDSPGAEERFAVVVLGYTPSEDSAAATYTVRAEVVPVHAEDPDTAAFR
ncbi:MAG: hypothetical protein M3P91_07985 [Actinomycetota bacterium]|nr:hypothetical protein [Actinomycetota bacterium]